MKRVLLLARRGRSLVSAPVSASDRYAERPPVVVSPDLSAPWVMQLGSKPGRVLFKQRKAFPNEVDARRNVRRLHGRSTIRSRTAAVAPQEEARRCSRNIDPLYLPQEVAYDGRASSRARSSSTRRSNFLYLRRGRRHGAPLRRRHRQARLRMGRHAQGDPQGGMARLAPAGRDDRARARRRAASCRSTWPGGPENPLGARALYLGSTLYRIHGTNQPWTIGQARLVRLHPHAQRGCRRPLRARRASAPRSSSCRFAVQRSGDGPRAGVRLTGKGRSGAISRPPFLFGFTATSRSACGFFAAIGPVEQFDRVDDRHAAPPRRSA